MFNSMLGPHTRVILTASVVCVTLVFYFTLMPDVYAWSFPFFVWMETTWFGVIGKSWGAAFAFVQTIQLLSLALLGGAVLAAEGRVLGSSLLMYQARSLLIAAMCC